MSIRNNLSNIIPTSSTKIVGSKAMKEFVEALAAKHGACFSGPGLAANNKNSLTLVLGKGWLPLYIDLARTNMVSVSHYYKQNGDMVPSPDIVFFTNPLHADTDGWIPLDHSTGPFYNLAATLNADLNQIERVVLPTLLPQLVEFADNWAANLREQGWLDRAVEASTGNNW